MTIGGALFAGLWAIATTGAMPFPVSFIRTGTGNGPLSHTAVRPMQRTIRSTTSGGTIT
jgi:hypothetical protein